jgi:NACHT domain- and WD repeat-containing protein
MLDAHFGRIMALEPLTIGNWNSVSRTTIKKLDSNQQNYLQIITSSIDRSVKVWNLNNIFEQVHAIDRHELQIDAIT